MSVNNQLSSAYSQDSYPQKSEKILRNRKKYRRYNWIFLLSAFLPIVGVGVFNIIIDPYDVFNTPNFLGINHSKPRKDNSDRLFKATDVIRIKPVTVFMGSSRTKRAIDPNYLALKNYKLADNLALTKGNFYELRRYLEHAIANQKELDLVVIGLDLFMFNSLMGTRQSFSEQRLEKKYLLLEDLINITFSLDALFASQETVIDSNKNLPNNIFDGENGFIPYLNVDPKKTKSRFEKIMGNYYVGYHITYQLSTQLLDEFKKVVDLCQQNQIKLISYISPAHATQWEIIKSSGQWSTFEEWKPKVVEISDVFDFSGYNSITSEPIQNEMENYTENSHYTPKVGNLILNRLLSYQEEEVPEDFGILINSENIESHLAKIRQDR